MTVVMYCILELVNDFLLNYSYYEVLQPDC